MHQTKIMIYDQISCWKPLKLAKFMEEWHFNMRITVWTRANFKNGWKSKMNGRMLVMSVLYGHRLHHMMRLRNRLISVTGTTEELTVIKLHVEWASVMKRGARLV